MPNLLHEAGGPDRIVDFTGCIYVLKGNREKAEETYRTILERYSVTSPKHVGLCRESLEEIVKENKPNSEMAKEILDWFRAPAWADSRLFEERRRVRSLRQKRRSDDKLGGTFDFFVEQVAFSGFPWTAFGLGALWMFLGR